MFKKFLPIASRSLQSAGEFLLSQLAETAFATTTGVSTPSTSTATTSQEIPDSSDEVESTSTPITITGEATSSPASVPDVSSCSTLDTRCHTMEFGGFGVSGSLTDKEFHGAVLNFSFANMSAESAQEDSKLEVRYFHAGKWQTAGEIYLNKEISNYTNGGYFTAKLSGINSWDDLSDLHVVVEFVRGDDRIENKIYLDSLWVDTSFKDRVQDVIAGNTSDITDAPDNVTFNLPQGSASFNTLVTDDGQHIDFPYVDTLTDDSLIVRMDKMQYQVPKDKSANTVYASITNTSQSPAKFRVYASFPGGKGDVLKIARYMRDVPVATSTPVYHDVTYYCGDGWQNASTTEKHECPSTQQSYACDAITDAGINCLVKNVHVDDATSTSYVSAWVDAPQTHVVDQDEQVSSVLPPGYSIAASTQDAFDILPGQTIYVQAEINTPDSTSRKFVLSVKGDGVFGDADSLRLKDETSWRVQLKFAKAQPERAHINDQLSGKNDFAVDELPSFRFKFKTQRSFFQRVLDFITRNNIEYRVDKAVLIRNDGEEEHVPVQIGYDKNGEWELQLDKPPRSFRPGKYTVELQMNEGGQTYTDSVDFYWGVLAVNSNKSTYAMGEAAHLMMAALDDDGNTLCDAQLDLNITDPSGATENIPVISGGGCGFNNVTDLPDYVADYSPSMIGDYSITLSRLDKNGAIINSTADGFSVEADPPVSIERAGPTRIYPVSTYKMRFNIQARDAFSGTVTEVLPEGFTVPGLGGGTLTRKNGALYLSWNIDLSAGASTTISYTFKAPEASPYLYILGPASMTEKTSGSQIFQEGRTWKIASDALSIATGVAWLSGTTTTNGVEINNTTASALAWTTDDYDTTYFSHSTSTNNTRLTVSVAGDYLVSVTLPIERTDTRNAVSDLETDIRVNGVKVNLGVGRSAYNERSTQTESSEHITVLLHNLNVNDYIEAYTRTISTFNALNTTRIGSQASLYAEYIPTSETIFSATATTTTTGTNVNPAATSSMVWYDVGSRVDSGYTHFNGPSTTAGVIKLPAAGDYLVSVNIPAEGAVVDGRARGRILIDGVIASSSDLRQDYIADATGQTQASMQWNGVIHATSSSNLSVTVQQNSAAGTLTVNADTASIYIQKLPSSDVYLGLATTTSSGTNFNAATAANILWQWDDIKDVTTYTHSTSTNPHQITVVKPGDYLLVFNEDLTGAINRGDPKMQVLVNGAVGTAETGAQAKGTFVTTTNGDGATSGTLVYLLRNLSTNDVISLQTLASGAAGTMTADKKALVMLWHKASQSNWIQDTEAWYQNVDAQTPTTAWPGTTQGDVITSGNAVLSGDVLRLRMALQAQTNTSAGADTFKLQYAAGSTCAASLTWTDVGATGSGSIWRAHDNASVAGGSTLTTQLLSVSSTSETYEESNPSAATPNGVSSGTDGEWDWSIENNGAAVGTSYCFRMVQSTGQSLKNYNDYPQLVTNNSPSLPALATPFDNEKLASTSPWFTFAASDDNGDDENYQVQISTVSNFASTVVDTDSNTNTNDFDNIQTPSDRQPFNAGETIRYKTASVLANGTTYYWRTRAIDPSGTNAYGSWSTTQSFTVDTSITVSTWFQTQTAQFNQGALSNVESTSTNDVGMSAGQTNGTIASPAITYEKHTTGNSWGALSKNDSYTAPNIIKYQIEYLDSTSTWTLVPDSSLTGNSTGTTTSSLSIAGLDPSIYDSIRIRANFTLTSATPRLSDWTVSWALSVARPTLTSLFDNEKTSTTTPSFKFTTTDPQSDKLTYQMQWSTDSTFAAGVSSSTSDNGTVTTYGWSDVSSSTQSSPYASGDNVQYTISTTTPLTNGTTYWWRVRAKDPAGNNAYSLWSTARSFTVDTTVDRSTWFQTTTDQFTTDNLSRVTATNNSVSGITDVGKIAIYRAATAGDAITTTILNHKFDTTVRQDDVYAMQFASSSILLKAGYYAVMYGFRADTTAGTSQSTMQSDLSLASTTLPVGWSSGLMRRTNGTNQAFNSGGAIVKATTDNTPLVLQTFRTDNLITNTETRTNNTPGLQLVRLDSTWPYLRLSKTGTQVGPTNANWVAVRYDREDEVNTDYYAHTQGNASITIYKTGHYLVFANTYGAVTAGTNNVITQKLVLNGSDVRGSFGSLYMSSTNANFEGAPTVGMILNVTTPTSTLSVQLNHTIGTNPWTIDANTGGTYVDRSGINIVKIPEGDFIRLSTSTAPTMNPTALTPVFWGVEDEKDTGSFTHSTGVNPNRVQVNVNGDYLAFTTLYASTTIQATTEYELGWQKNGAGGFIQYGLSGGYNNSATVGNTSGNWTGTILPSLVNGDFFESVAQGISTNVNGLRAADRELEAVRIASLTENDTTLQTVQSSDIVFSNGNGPRWDAITWSDTTPGITDILYSLYYFNTASSSYALVPDSALTGKNPQLTNSAGTSSSPIDISGLDRTTYGTLRLLATLNCAGGLCPTLNDWTVTWNPGVTVSGIAKKFDEATNVTSGTVAVAINGTIQSGKTAIISGSGTWTLNGINAGIGDVITVWIAGAADANEAVAITKPTQSGNVTNIALYEGHLTLGSDDNPTISNTDISQYDNSVSSNEDIFDDVDASGNLTVCSITGCFLSKLLVKSGTVYRPSSGSSVNVNTRYFENDGTVIADGNVFNISGSYKNTYVFTKNSSTVVFTATSTTEIGGLYRRDIECCIQ
jgi:hypothetical protein